MATMSTRLTTDGWAWLRVTSPGIAPTDQIAHFPRYRLRIPFRDTPTLPLIRGRHASLYATTLLPGEESAPLQAYDDDAIFLVLGGQATFFSESEEPVRLRQHEGLLATAGTPYRYCNSGEGLLVVLRGAGREQESSGADLMPIGNHPGSTEGISWRRDLWSGIDEQRDPFHRFDLRLSYRTPETPPWRTVARGPHLAMHVSSLDPGAGEVGLHSHDDEGIWVVLHGQVTFWGDEDNHELFTLRDHDGVLIPEAMLYRYMNTGDGYLVMLRFGGRGTLVPPLPS